MKGKYVKPEKNIVVLQRQLTLDGIRFVKRMTNIPALPGRNKFDLGGKLMNEIIDQRLLNEIIAILEYGFKNGEKQILNEAIEAIFNISKYGKMALR